MEISDSERISTRHTWTGCRHLPVPVRSSTTQPAPTDRSTDPGLSACPTLSTSYQALAPIDRFLAFLSEHITLITSLWMAGLLFFGFRLTGGLLYIQHLKLSARLPEADHWQHILEEMADRLNISFLSF
jgi:hypothetical protein